MALRRYGLNPLQEIGEGELTSFDGAFRVVS